jgi:hypothetical protein
MNSRSFYQIHNGNPYVNYYILNYVYHELRMLLNINFYYLHGNLVKYTYYANLNLYSIIKY